MDRVRRAWAWVVRHWRPVSAALAALLAILGAGWITAQNRRVRSLEAERKIQEARRKIAALDARRAALAENRERNAQAIAILEGQRQDIARAALALDGEVGAMTDEEVRQAFADLL